MGKLFLKGLAVTIPVALTVAIVWWLASIAEQMLGGLLVYLLPEGWYVPGMGIVAGIALIFLVGLLSHVIIFQKLFEWGEVLLNRLPLVKSIYSALKDFIGYLSPGSENAFGKSRFGAVTRPGLSIAGVLLPARPLMTCQWSLRPMTQSLSICP